MHVRRRSSGKPGKAKRTRSDTRFASGQKQQPRPGGRGQPTTTGVQDCIANGRGTATTEISRTSLAPAGVRSLRMAVALTPPPHSGRDTRAAVRTRTRPFAPSGRPAVHSTIWGVYAPKRGVSYDTGTMQRPPERSRWALLLTEKKPTVIRARPLLPLVWAEKRAHISSESGYSIPCWIPRRPLTRPSLPRTSGRNEGGTLNQEHWAPTPPGDPPYARDMGAPQLC